MQSWRWPHIRRFDGRQEREAQCFAQVALTVGDFALTTLADARPEAKAMLVEIAAGRHPRDAKREAIGRLKSGAGFTTGPSFVE
jgi:hypothetical protein